MVTSAGKSAIIGASACIRRSAFFGTKSSFRKSFVASATEWSRPARRIGTSPSGTREAA